jgi:hypothetical protein
MTAHRLFIPLIASFHLPEILGGHAHETRHALCGFHFLLVPTPVNALPQLQRGRAHANALWQTLVHSLIDKTMAWLPRHIRQPSEPTSQVKKREGMKKKDERERKTKYDKDKGVRDIRRSETGLGLTVHLRPPSMIQSPITFRDLSITLRLCSGTHRPHLTLCSGTVSTTPQPQLEACFPRLHVKFGSHIVQRSTLF